MKTADEIYQKMCSDFADRAGVPVRDGSDMAVRLYTAAVQIESLYVYNDWVKDQCFPQTAGGEYLDYHAEMRGLRRQAATNSTGYIKFSAARNVDQDTVVPVGTVCITASGMRFVTMQTGTITAGTKTCSVISKSVEKGSENNVEANTVVYMAHPPVGIVSCVNESPFIGGLDDEDDEALRKKILNNYTTLPNGANVSYYEKEAMSVNGVAAVKVIPRSRGVGTVDIIVASSEGIPGIGVVQAVEDKIDLSREICVDVDVYAPTPVTVNVSLRIAVENGYSFNVTTIRVARALNSYFDGTLLGKDVLLAKLGSIVYGVEGVKNYVFLTPVGDITVADDELPILGDLSIADWNNG